MAIKLHEIDSVKLVITHYWPAIGLILAGLWTCIGLILAYVGPISAAYGPCIVGLTNSTSKTYGYFYNQDNSNTR